MKKIMLAITSLVFMASFLIEQDKKAKTKEAVPAAKSAEVKKAIPAAKPASIAAPAAISGKTKADGTPDMRYKENKGKAAPVTGPTKKDGTPDMRYNKNKPNEAPKKKG